MRLFPVHPKRSTIRLIITKASQRSNIVIQQFHHGLIYKLNFETVKRFDFYSFNYFY